MRDRRASVSFLLMIAISTLAEFALASGGILSTEREHREFLIDGTLCSLHGRIDTVHVDYLDGQFDEEYYFTTADGSSNKLYFLDPPDVRSGNYAILGLMLNKEILVVSAVAIEADEIGEFETTGEQRMLVVLFNFEDNNVEPVDPSGVYQMVFGDENSVSSYIEEVSYGKTYLAGNVTNEWHTIPATAKESSCDYGLIRYYALSFALEHFDMTNYEHLMIVAGGSMCQVPGVTFNLPTTLEDEGEPVTLMISIINRIEHLVDTNIGAHEFGHHLGLDHANDWECGPNVLRGVCNSISYGNSFDTMGRAQYHGHFNALLKDQLSWFDEGEVQEVRGNGIYTILPIESADYGVKALKVFEGDRVYYVEYRRPIGSDVLLAELFGEEIFEGALVNMKYHVDGDISQLLDFTPHAGSGQFTDSLDSVLRAGETFEFPIGARRTLGQPAYQKSLEVVEVNPDYLVVRVSLTR